MNDILDELYYVNIHTLDNPTGELRAQVMVDGGLFRFTPQMQPIAYIFVNLFRTFSFTNLYLKLFEK